MKITIFVGPSATRAEVLDRLDAEVLPPAQAGDIYRAALRSPDAIGLVDGYFDRVAAPWHKEVLWAMGRGMRVFGAASLGALRATELAPFGMIGVGEIFRAYFKGDLTDDDEVAIVHAPADYAFRPLSEALVNIRMTVAHAFLEGVVSAAVAEILLREAKALPYAERSYTSVLHRSAPFLKPSAELTRFRSWLRKGAINQKKVDALALCEAIPVLLSRGLGAPKAEYTLAHTDAWEHARRQFEARGDVNGGIDCDEIVLDELRVLGHYPAIEGEAVARNLSARFPFGDSQALASIGSHDLCSSLGLTDQDDLRRWLETQDVPELSRRAFMKRQGRYACAKRIVRQSCLVDAVDSLRARGLYNALLERARDKQRVLAAVGAGTGSAIAESDLWLWYTAEVIQCTQAPPVSELASALGFAGVKMFEAAVRREYLYRQGVDNSVAVQLEQHLGRLALAGSGSRPTRA